MTATHNPDEVRERMARAEYHHGGPEGPYVLRLEAGAEAYTWHLPVPGRLLAAYEQAKTAFDTAEAALTAWVDENSPEEIEPTW